MPNNNQKISNAELAERLRTLQRLPDEQLNKLFTDIYKKDPPSNRKMLIRALVETDQISWQKSDTEEETLQIVKQMKASNELRRLMKVVFAVNQTDNAYTYLTLKKMIDFIYEVPDDELVLLNQGTQSNLKDFFAWLQEATGDNPNNLDKVSIEGKEKFKEMIFITAKQDIINKVLQNICMDATSVLRNEGTVPQGDIVGGYYRCVDAFCSYITSDAYMVAPDESRFSPELTGEDFATGVSVSVVSDEGDPAETPTEETVPGMPDLNTHLGGLMDGVDESGLDAPADFLPLHKQVWVIKANESQEAADKVADIKSKVGTLMFPNEYRQIQVNQITAKSWKKCRKQVDITGRCEIYIKTDPGSTQQNTAITYKHGHFCDASWEGAYADGPSHSPMGVEGKQYVSDHPYGQLIILNYPKKD